MRLSVIIPVYNEVRTVEAIVDRVLGLPLPTEVVLVDDGSTDGTREVLGRLAGRAGVRILLHPVNRGKGAAVRTGLAFAEGEVCVIQDADLEYDPSAFLDMLKPIADGKADVVYGSRFRGHVDDMSWLHRFGNRILTGITNLLYGGGLTDMETCYKMFRTRVIRQIPLAAERFEIEPEITAKLLRHGHQILEVPIAYQGRSFHEGKKITWVDGFTALRVLLRYRFGAANDGQRPEAGAMAQVQGSEGEPPTSPLLVL